MAISTAIDLSAVARVVGIKTKFVNRLGGVTLLPQRVMVVGQGATLSTYDTTKRQVFSAGEAGSLYGFGSPIHLAVSQLLPFNNDGVGSIPVTVYPLDDHASGVASTGAITPTGAQTTSASYRVRLGGQLSEAFVISVGDSVATITAAMTAAINSNVGIPMVAADGGTVVNLTSKWEGASANDIAVEVIGDVTLGTAFGITAPTGGLVNPDVDLALNQVGDIWETIIVNCMNGSDTTTLDKFSTFGEGRWGALTRKPVCGAFHGSVETDVVTAGTIPDARKTDRTNAMVNAPGSIEMPLVIAARAVARIAKLANNNPPSDYGSQALSGLVPGTDAQQFMYNQRDAAVKLGVTTTQVKDGVINLSDTVTFYHPTGEVVPAYRFVVDIVKLQQIIFNLDLIFNSPEWDGKPLIPDNQPTTNRDAKKPNMAKAVIATMLDSLGNEAIISDPDAAKAATLAQINETNPKRLDIALSVQLSGNTNIISIDLDFGFYFGQSTFVA